MPVRGIWTPTAEVLCLSCHGQRTWNGWPVPSPESWQRRTEPVQADVGEAVARCDRCGRGIVVAADVAVLQGVCQALRAAGLPQAVMEQAGGMCAAVLIPRPDGGRVQVYADEAADGMFIVTSAKPDADDEDVVGTVRGRGAAVAAVKRALC
jgi:hypothetical protein